MTTSAPTPPIAPFAPAVLYLSSVGTEPFSEEKGLVKLELSQDATHPLLIMLPYTLEEAVQQGNTWVTTWQLIRRWPGARALNYQQWLLLWTLCRTLHWFAQPDIRPARRAAWPDFMKAYLLLGEVGRHFTFSKPIKDDLLLHFLLTWVRERIPQALAGSSPGFDLPIFVVQRAHEVLRNRTVTEAT